MGTGVNSVSGGDDKATARTVAVIVLVVLAAAALRGYLPGAAPPARDPESEGTASLLPVIVMVVLALAIIATAILRQARHPGVRPGPAGEIPAGRPGRGTGWSRRTLLILLAVTAGWLAIVVFLMRVRGWLELPEPASPPRDVPTPAGAPATAEPDPPEAGTGGVGVFGYLSVAAAVLMVLSAVATTLGRRRRPPAAPLDSHPGARPAAPTGSQTLARAAERGLAEIGDRRREPRAAIIACYAVMERELAKAPGAVPLDSDTPSEVLARAVQRGLLRADSATELVDLFEEARFSPHLMAEVHRDAAERVLRLVLGQLQSAEAVG
ncbi:DUF4129 domain-containing protein [Mycobacterium sp. WMMD1722]|uniref:DUF4129 domain-containing protein n=1 Tax=Mycobacterium sp. WMMD1722 TaxID=3404117 RepID=UPI003BF4ADD1